MIVTLCGAYKNAGDHLIGERARALLREHVDKDIMVVDRMSITENHYSIFNQAKVVLLTGGPAYQSGMYPKIYPLELDKISAPIIPYGLGCKSNLDQPTNNYFSDESINFIRKMHANINHSSARDPLTVKALSDIDVDNVSMTGCPAWYDLAELEARYVFKKDVKVLVVSMPAKMQAGVKDLILWLTERFPKARRVLTFHHGVIPSWNSVGRKKAIDFMTLSAKAIQKGWEISSLSGSLKKLEDVYSVSDLHVGYRVHAHIYCLSKRSSSILINEDSRGVGQASALGAYSLNMDKTGSIDLVKDRVENHFVTSGEEIHHSVEKMRATYPVMTDFLKSL